MARYVDNLSYGGSVDGSMAYDLGNPSLYPDYTIDAPKRTAQPKRRVRSRVHPRSKQIVSPGAVLGFAVAAMLLFMSLVSQIKLTEISDQTAKLQSTLGELKTQESELKIEYERAFNLTEIESFALTELGMQKPYGDQVRYINGASPDNAVIIRGQAEPEDGIIDRVESFFMSIGEYFE